MKQRITFGLRGGLNLLCTAGAFALFTKTAIAIINHVEQTKSNKEGSEMPL